MTTTGETGRDLPNVLPNSVIDLLNGRRQALNTLFYTSSTLCGMDLSELETESLREQGPAMHWCVRQQEFLAPSSFTSLWSSSSQVPVVPVFTVVIIN
jgi:hypothetical protein